MGGRCTVHPKTLPHTLYTSYFTHTFITKVLQKHSQQVFHKGSPKTFTTSSPPQGGIKALNNGYVTHFWISPFLHFFGHFRANGGLKTYIIGGVGAQCTLAPSTLPYYSHYTSLYNLLRNLFL